MSYAKPTTEDLEFRFRYHPPRDQVQRDKYDHIRKSCLVLAKEIVRQTPCCPEQTRALNALDEVMFLSNSAIARHEEPPPKDE